MRRHELRFIYLCYHGFDMKKKESLRKSQTGKTHPHRVKSDRENINRYRIQLQLNIADWL